MTATASPVSERIRGLPGAGAVELACTLSLIVVVLNTNEDRLLFVLAIAALAVGLLRPGLARHPAWWITLAIVIGARQISAWEGVDNHVVVTTYWCLALGVGLLADDPARTIARSARLLIGLVFGFAVYWKLAAPEFATGDFFRYTLLFDERFDEVARWIAGVTGDAYEANQAAMANLTQDLPDGGRAALEGGPRLGLVAVAMAWFAIVTEGAIAAAHLLPLRGRLAVARPVALLGFCVGTYLVVPVGGFGCLLVTMALVDADLSPRWRAALLWLFGGLVLYGPVWKLAFG